VVIDTVKGAFARKFISNLSQLVNPGDIDYIVVNHSEPDHSGSLQALLEAAPKARVFASRAAKLYLGEMLNRPFECCSIDDCREVDLGQKTLKFIPAPFLHWPDTIFTYLQKDRVLFSCDAFGSHFCDERMFDDLADDFRQDQHLYYDALMRPFREKVLAAIERVKDLDLKVICPSHGPILRTDPNRYIERYTRWATLPERPKKYIAVIYCSAHGNTAAMARAVGEGASRLDVDVELIHATEVEESRIRTAMESADGLLFGTPTIVRDVPPPMWRVLSLLSTVQVRARHAGAFFSYGWSGEGARFVEQRLRDMRLSLQEPSPRVKFTPTEKDLQACREFGEKFAAVVLCG